MSHPLPLNTSPRLRIRLSDFEPCPAPLGMSKERHVLQCSSKSPSGCSFTSSVPSGGKAAEHPESMCDREELLLNSSRAGKGPSSMPERL